MTAEQVLAKYRFHHNADDNTWHLITAGFDEWLVEFHGEAYHVSRLVFPHWQLACTVREPRYLDAVLSAVLEPVL